LIGVLTNELLPGAEAATRGGHQIMTTENAANGDMGAAIAELQQLALNATVAPARVLPSQAHDQLVKLARGRKLPAWALTKGRPFPADNFPVPAEERLAAGQERARAGAAQDAAEGGKQQAISWLPSRSPSLALENP
jgi:hypothetical protein